MLRSWHEASNNVVLLVAPDELALGALATRAAGAGVAVSTFREPDFGDALTGVAIGPEGARLVAATRATAAEGSVIA